MVDKKYYISSAAHGLVLAPQPDGKPSRVTAQTPSPDDKNEAQQWELLPGHSPEFIFIRNCLTGEYLRAEGDSARADGYDAQGTAYDGSGSWAPLAMGKDQPWKVSHDKVIAKSACRLSPWEYPHLFLNHQNGKRESPAFLHVAEWAEGWEWALSWYLVEVGAGFSPLVKTPAQIAEFEEHEAKVKQLEDQKSAFAHRQKVDEHALEVQSKDMARREKELARKEVEAEGRRETTAAEAKQLAQKSAALAKKEQVHEQAFKAQQKDLDQIQATLEQRSRELAAQEAAQNKLQEQLEEKEEELGRHGKVIESNSAQGAELERKLGEIQAAERSLVAKQAALDKQQKQNKIAAADLKTKGNAIKSTEQDLDAEKAAVDTQKQQLQAKEAELREKEAKIERNSQQASSREKAFKMSAARAEEENAKLRYKLKQLEAKLKQHEEQLEAKLRQLEALFASVKQVTPVPATNGNERQQASSREKAYQISAAKAEEENAKLRYKLKQLEAKLTQHEVQLEVKLRQLEAQFAAARQILPHAITRGTAPDQDRLVRLEAENSRLKNLVAQHVRLQQGLAPQQGRTSSSGASGRPAATVKSQGVGTSSSAPPNAPKTNASQSIRPSSGGLGGAPPAKGAKMVHRSGLSTPASISTPGTSTPVLQTAPKPVTDNSSAFKKPAKLRPSGTKGLEGDVSKTVPKTSAQPNKSLAGGPKPGPKLSTVATGLQKQQNPPPAVKGAAQPAKAPAKPMPTAAKPPTPLPATLKPPMPVPAGKKLITATKGNVNTSSRPVASTSGPNSSTQRLHHTTAHHHAEADAVRFGCGHVAYPLPRKLNRKMIGVLYE